MTVVRNTSRRERFRRHWRKLREDCHRCHQPIDYEADHLQPDSFQVDHITPLARGGTDTLDNTQPVHRRCNRDKGDKLEAELSGAVTFITHREWQP